MDAPFLLWNVWAKQVKQLFPDLHGHQQKSFAFIVYGIMLTGSAVLQQIAEEVCLKGISSAKMLSIERRLARFIANSRFNTFAVRDSFLRQILATWSAKRMIFVLDPTPFNDQTTIVYIGLLVHSRVLPIVWCLAPAQKQWEEKQWDMVRRLLDQLIALLGPSATDCVLLADRGLSCLTLAHICEERKWHYVLRIRNEYECRRLMRKKWTDWSSFNAIINKKGQQWFGKARVWKGETLETNLSACWDEKFEEAWILISDLPSSKKRIHEYRLRMRVESTFQDTKSRKFNIEASHITDPERLDRLLLALFLAIWWSTNLAASCIHDGKRHLLDRHDRRDKGIFRLGHLWLLYLLKEAGCASSQTPIAALLSHSLPFKQRNGIWHFILRW